MSQDFQPGDFLVFQLEAGFGLLRFLGHTERDGARIWHLTAYDNLFMDVDSVEVALAKIVNLSVSHAHLALTTRAFESTQVARMGNEPLTENDLQGFNEWVTNGNSEASDRSVRLLLGLR